MPLGVLVRSTTPVGLRRTRLPARRAGPPGSENAEKALGVGGARANPPEIGVTSPLYYCR